MLEAIPDDPNFAIVIVHHLARDKPSLAPELLAKCTKMPIKQVDDSPIVKPGHAYVIPPGKYLSIVDGRLQLTKMEGPRRVPVAIDFFFRALAKDQKECAVGIILSGTGSDGTLGVKAIKEAGGLVLAQDPRTALHDGMPDSAIHTGIVDQVLAPEDIPAALARFADHDYMCGDPETRAMDPGTVATIDSADREPSPTDGTRDDQDADEHGLTDIITILRSEAKRDFQNYKTATLSRRTRRRMCLHHIGRYNDYVKFLNENRDEIHALAKDLLISVTDFFRDREVWEELIINVIPRIIQSKSNDDVVRVWVAGCATGEEAYTAAMLMLEEISKQRKTCKLQLFASDIDADALQLARAGRYPISIEADVSPERIKRFFNLQDGGLHYEVKKSLRETVVFAEQNMISDPPFSHLDLLCCRNVLIYLKPSMQQKLIGLFHFALRQEGFLMLGTAETIGRQDDLFATIDKRGRIYQSINTKPNDRVGMPPIRPVPLREHDFSVSRQPTKRPSELAKQILFEMTSARALLIDRRWRIHYISGNINPYVMHQEGVPSDDLLKKLDPNLRSQVRAAVHRAFEDGSSASVVCRVLRPAGFREVRIEVRIVPSDGVQDDFALVIFDESDKASPGSVRLKLDASPSSKDLISANRSSRSESSLSNVDDRTLADQLEKELSVTKDDLQSTIEQFEAANEGFKASHEEVMSINEELQSTNEELETSKEELQSANEELSTVNQQLAGKVSELEVKHADLENLIAATEVATVCLDTDLVIRWFTPATGSLIRIKPTDVGRPLQDLQNDFLINNLFEECERVLQKLVASDHEIDCSDDRAFIRRIMPYQTDDHRIGGVVITLVDITARRKREQDLRDSEAQLRKLNTTLEQQVAQRTELLGILQHVTQAANEARSVEEAMRATMEKLARFNSWRVGHVWLMSDNEVSGTRQMRSSKFWHVHDEFIHGIEHLENFQRLSEQMLINFEDGIVGQVMKLGRPQQVHDIREQMKTPRTNIAGLGLRGAIAFPITVDSEVVAIMEFFSDQATDPEPDFLSLMPVVGIQLGHLIQRKRLEQVVKDIADEEEKRIGRELHDGIAQQLTGGALIAESLRRSLPAEMTPQIASAEHLIEILQDTHEDVSRLSQGLMSDSLHAKDLLASLTGIVAEAQSRFEIDITLQADEVDESFVENDAAARTIYQVCAGGPPQRDQACSQRRDCR